MTDYKSPYRDLQPEPFKYYGDSQHDWSSAEQWRRDNQQVLRAGYDQIGRMESGVLAAAGGYISLSQGNSLTSPKTSALISGGEIGDQIILATGAMHGDVPYVANQLTLRPESISNAADSAAVDAAAGGSARLRYMGATPDKFSRTGAEVVERMRGDGLIVGDGPLLRGNPNDLQLVTDNGLVRIDSTIDMAHQTDAVSWWNSTGRFYGAKAPEVRQFMLDSDNYILQPRSINRSEGAQLRQTYLPPEPPTFTTLKR